MKKYILASDYDGTLCQGSQISENTIGKINEFRQNGHLFGVVTGRDYTNGFNYFKSNNNFPFDFIITSNGASACDKNGDIYFVNMVKNKDYQGNSLAYDLINLCFDLSERTCAISCIKKRLDFHPQYPYGKEGQYCSVAELEKLDEFVSASVECVSEQHAENVVKEITKVYGNFVNPMQNGRFIDITPKCINKATGIAQLADCLGIEHDNIWTAGDNYNDMNMVEKYHGCAMTKGVDQLKNVAEYVCDNVEKVIEIIMEHNI